MIATITPFHNQVILTPIAARGQTDGGIIIPEAHRAVINQGTVVDKGPHCTDQIQIGQIVFFPLHSEARLKYKGNDYIIVPESACLGAIQEVNETDPPTKEKVVPVILEDYKPSIEETSSLSVRTQCRFIDCQRALATAKGDETKAIELLRKHATGS